MSLIHKYSIGFAGVAVFVCVAAYMLYARTGGIVSPTSSTTAERMQPPGVAHEVPTLDVSSLPEQYRGVDESETQGMDRLGSNDLYYKVIDNDTLELYNSYAKKRERISISDAETFMEISTTTEYGFRLPTFAGTRHTLYTVFNDRGGPELKKLADVDTTTARMVGTTFVVAGDGVFTQNGRQTAVRDAKTFRIAFERMTYYGTDDSYYRDTLAVYAPRQDGLYLSLVALPYDVATFAVFAESGYTKDAGGVYFEGGHIAGADPATFSLIATPKLTSSKSGGPMYFYAKDAQSVYYKGVVLKDANPRTFVGISEKTGTVNHPYGTDGTRVFFEDRLIPGADPVTFRVLWYYVYEGCAAGHYAKDAHAVYYDSYVVEGADAATFEATDVFLGKDKHGFWRQQFFRPDITETPVCDFG